MYLDASTDSRGDPGWKEPKSPVKKDGKFFRVASTMIQNSNPCTRFEILFQLAKKQLTNFFCRLTKLAGFTTAHGQAHFTGRELRLVNLDTAPAHRGLR